jgi:hypothetical protein
MIVQRRAKFLVGIAVVLGALGIAGPAHAENCVGTQNIFMICVEPTGGELYRDCIYTGGDTCEEVVVPGPVVTRCGNTQISCM